MIETLDKNIGKLLQSIRDLGLEKKTLIIFASDNGGVHWPSRQVLPETSVTSNNPLRGGKATIYEGGTRVPCVVYWPGITKPGAVSEQVVSSIDWYPTLLEIAGIKAKQGQEFDGISIVPALKGKLLKRKAIYCHFPQGDGCFAEGHQPSTYVREGDWKLIRFFCDNPDQSDRFELYNVKNDIGEQIGLINRFPGKTHHLKKMINRFLQDTKAVVPIPNPHYNTSK
jgi:arylsulfatase A-like enzyme